MLRHALKEWAVICQALASGRQAVLLRKGGIAERDGQFQVEHARFWLYPTYVHQQRGGIKEEAFPLFEAAEKLRPEQGTIHLTHFAEVQCAYQVDSLSQALCLQDLHCWSEETIRSRFAYRQPGLFVLPLRVFHLAQGHQVAETVGYTGCKSWVDLDQELSTQNADPVLKNEEFDQILKRLEHELIGL